MKKIISIVILICLVLAGSQMLFITGVSEDENNDPKETRSGSRGNTLYVGSGQTYSGIQAAIDAANSGDTIRVYDGTYLENVIVDKTLSLIGNGTTKTIIDGDGSGDVVLLKSNWVNITGFKIINSGSEDLFPTVDAGIDVDNVDFVTIKNNNCSNNLYGIFNYKSNFTTIENNTCSNNTLDGIYIYLSDNN